MGRIAVTDGMSEEAVKLLEDKGHEVVLRHYDPDEISTGSLAEFDAVIIRSATKLPAEQIAASTSVEGGLRFIGRAGVGVDNIDINEASKHGIVVCNTPGASTRSVIEITIGHLIASTRNIATADRTLRAGLWAKKNLRGTEIGGKNLGLIGFGRIAQGVAKAAISFGMDVHAYDPFVNKEFDGITMHDGVDDVFSKCTHISVHCNLTDETRHMINTERISMMPGVGADGIDCGNHIVSCARGGIVDEDAALQALESGQLRTLALDVFESEPLGQSPLLNHDSFHGSPHIAASTLEAQARIGIEMASLLIEVFDSGKTSTSLNF